MKWSLTNQGEELFNAGMVRLTFETDLETADEIFRFALEVRNSIEQRRHNELMDSLFK